MSNASEHQMKEWVRTRYTQIATSEMPVSSCCSSEPTQPQNKVYQIMMDDYSDTPGYAADADLGLGCGLPTQFAQIKPGDVVIDLGSGAGNDCFVARHETGPSGKVIGIDFTPAMIDRARANAEKLGYHNVEFREGDIDHMPVRDEIADVIVSNCVLNLVPNKEKVMTEMYRVLKPGGHFSISDIVLVGQLPPKLKQDAELYAGCVTGAIQKEEYLQKIEAAGFEQVTIQKSKVISLPLDLLQQHLTEDEIQSFQSNQVGIFSITVFGVKPVVQPSTCC